MINKILRILSLTLISIGSLHLAGEDLLSYANEGIGIILLSAGLIGACFLLATDIIRRNNHKIQLGQIRILDYLAFILWVLALILAFNESFINRSVYKILDIKVFEIVNWVIIVVFLIAISILAICLFTFNRSRYRQYSLKIVVPVICCALFIPSVLTPIDSFSAGCPMEEMRLSVLNGGQQRIEELRKQARDEREQRNAKYPGLSEGCSGEPLYVLYIL